MTGRWDLLVWFASQEPILTPDERADILNRVQQHPRYYADKSNWWWRYGQHLQERAA